MKAKERALKALFHEEPDVVPIFEPCIAPNVAEKILGRTLVYYNAEVILKMCARGVPMEKIEKMACQDVIDLFHKKLHHDIILASPFGASLWDFIGVASGFGGVINGAIDPSHEPRVKHLGGNRWQINDFQYIYLPDSNMIVPDPQFVSKPEDVEKYINENREKVERPSWGGINPLILKELGDEVLLIGGIGKVGGFELWEIRHLLPWLYTNREVVKHVIEFEARNCINCIKLQSEMGIRVFLLDCDLAYNHGPFMSPRDFREIWYPALKSVVDAAHKKNGLLIFHSDGNINLLLEDIVHTGIDGLHAIQPSAGMDIKSIKDRFGDRIFLMGNIDISYPLTFGTVEETVETVKSCINAAASGGGYVICSANGIHPGVKAENYMAMCEAARRYGKYPIHA
jgi:uroporphyrinogen-III decarboxylase